MKVVKKNNNWDQKQGYSKKVLLNENDLNYKGGLVQEIRIKPRETAGDHYHEKQTEIFYFLSSNGYWIINGTKFVFDVGDTLMIEPGDKHLVSNNSKEDYVYLAFKFNYEATDLYWTN